MMRNLKGELRHLIKPINNEKKRYGANVMMAMTSPCGLTIWGHLEGKSEHPSHFIVNFIRNLVGTISDAHQLQGAIHGLVIVADRGFAFMR